MILLATVLAYALTLSALGALFWFLRRHSPPSAAIYVAGVAVRGVAGVVLYAASEYQWPLFRSLQAGDGFWTLAIDARSYYEDATLAVAAGLSTVDESGPSPAYVRALAASMLVFGVTPLSSVLLNVIFYALSVFLVAAAAPPGRAVLFALAAMTFSPALVVFSTQPLKDPYCVMLIALAFAGARDWSTGVLGAQRPSRQLLGAGALALAVYVVSGIRAYFGLFILLAVLCSGGWSLIRQPRRFIRIVPPYGLLTAFLWLSFATGAGAYYPYYDQVIRAALGRPAAPVEELNRARAGFAATGGATNMTPTRSAEATGESVEGLDIAQGLSGLATMVIPISLLRAIDVVDFSGGRGLLIITDIDTVWLLGSILVAVWILRDSRDRRVEPIAIFGVVLIAITALSMSYVVTNFGTLFRLRLLVAAPLWLLPAFAEQDPPTAESASAVRSAPSSDGLLGTNRFTANVIS